MRNLYKFNLGDKFKLKDGSIAIIVSECTTIKYYGNHKAYSVKFEKDNISVYSCTVLESTIVTNLHYGQWKSMSRI